MFNTIKLAVIKGIRLIPLSLTVLLGSSAQSFAEQPMEPMVGVRVTTQMIENGKPDTNRYFIFNFQYTPLARYCSVDSITINNVNCGENSIGGIRGFWLKHEHSSKEYSGDRFTCKLSRVSNDRWMLVVEDPVDASGKIIHRMILKNERLVLRELIDYSGQMSKLSSITKKIESVNYLPISKTSSSGWASLSLGCDRMASPVLSK